MTTMRSLLTQIEAAELLSLGVRTLEKYRVTGLGPRFIKLNKSVRYRPEDLESWVAARVVKSTSETGGRNGRRPRR